MDEKFYTVEEVASAFRVSEATIYDLIKSGELPHIRVKKSIRISDAHIKEFQSSNSSLNEDGDFVTTDNECST